MKMKKTILLAVFILSSGILCGADYHSCVKEADAAMKAKDYETAVAKYDEAVKNSKRSIDKRSAVYGKYRALKAQKKWKEADNYMLEIADSDETLDSKDARFLLTMVAGGHLWDRYYEDALKLLQQAQNIQAPKASNEYYLTYYYMATIYGARKKQYSAAIETLKDVITIKELHPANLYTANMVMGDAYEKLGKKEEALKHYKAALESGKKVKYKYNYSGASKAIERLSK